MSEYTAPLRDMRFVLEHLADLEAIASLPGFEHVDVDGVYSVLEENARFMEDLVAPLNRVGDVQGSVRNDDGSVTTPDGFVAAYKAYVDAGWGCSPPPTWPSRCARCSTRAPSTCSCTTRRRPLHEDRAAGRRQLPHHRHEDLHLLRRARHEREHHPPGAGSHAVGASRHQGHQLLHRAQVPLE